VSADRRDRVCDLPFGADGRRLGVRDFGERQTPRTYRRHRRQLRGKSAPARRSGRHRRRCTGWRDGGSRASRVLGSVPGPVPVSAPGNRARSASAVWPDRPGDRKACPVGRWQANTWRVRRRPRAIRSAAIPHRAVRPATHHDGLPAPEPEQSARSARPRLPRARRPSASLPAASRAQAPSLTGRCSASRRISFGRRPRPDQGSGGSGAVPGGHTELCGGMPAT
jgi:hypothetical protein